MPLKGYSVIYGGSFDPPHMGHRIASVWMIDALRAEEVIIVPTFQHAFGKKLTDFQHRVRMCMLANHHQDFNFTNGRVWVSEIEETLPHPNFTINTLKAMMNDEFLSKKVAVAVGSDLLPNLHNWHGWDEVMKLAKIVVIGRQGSNVPSGLDVFQYPIELSAISSSEIREKIMKGDDITGLVPYSVKEYIEANGLYL